MEKLKAVINKYWKVYVAALIIAAVCDLIGTLKFNIGIGTLTLFPMVFATIFGGLLGPDAFKLFKTEESKLGGSLVLVALAPFMAKMGISAGGNLAKLVAVGPALLLQEFGNLGTILLSLPLALLLGLKKEAIGACYSINRDSNLGLTRTAFIILFSGAPLDGSSNGVQLTQQALTNEIGASGSIFVAVALFFFAFSSILGNYYYGEANIRFITAKKWVLHTYRILVSGMVLFGSVATLDLVWSLADITMALMAVCNLIAIIFLGKYAIRLLSDYRAQKKAGIQSPVFRKETMPDIEKDLECW